MSEMAMYSLHLLVPSVCDLVNTGHMTNIYNCYVEELVHVLIKSTFAQSKFEKTKEKNCSLFFDRDNAS